MKPGSSPDGEPYRSYHARRSAERRAAREELRQRQLARVREAVATLAPEHPAVLAVYLYGSLLKPGRFTEGSDVDLAVECADLEAESRFWRALEERLERDVDLRPRTGTVALAVELGGECLYEREAPGPGT